MFIFYQQNDIIRQTISGHGLTLDIRGKFFLNFLKQTKGPKNPDLIPLNSSLFFKVISSTTQQGVIVPIYFKILDMINIFQAVAIFIIFVVKVDIRNSLENKYPRFQRKFKQN